MRSAATLLLAAALGLAPGGALADGGLNVRARSELSAYTDTDHTQVVTPALQASVESPTGGWGATGSYLVDVVSAASADIVATASPHWTEVRNAAALSGHRRLGIADLAAHGSLSSEPDYLSMALGASVAVDLHAKTVTPSLGYTYAHDTVGRADTPFAVFARPISRHSIDAAMGLVVDKSTVFIASISAILEVGDSSKPYRAIPMFDPADAARVTAGMSVRDVNRLRTVDRPLEQLPTDRQRWALEGRLLHRFSRATVRFGERLYTDSWGLHATTSDLALPIDVGRLLRVGPHLRLHAQTGVDFWRLTYTASLTPGGTRLPALRTGDRELGPLVAPTTGLAARLQLGRQSRWSIRLEGDATFTWFLDHLFIERRTSLLGTTILDVELP